MRTDDVKPRNPNIQLFMGYMIGGIKDFYKVTHVDDIKAKVTFEAPNTGNRYRVTVEQIKEGKGR